MSFLVLMLIELLHYTMYVHCVDATTNVENIKNMAKTVPTNPRKLSLYLDLQSYLSPQS